MMIDGAFNVIGLPDINYEGGVLAYGAKVAIHYIHRLTALFLTIFYIITLYMILRLKKHEILKKIMLITTFFFVLQITLGISNVVYSLPISVAVWHTMNAAILMALMSSALYYSVVTFYKVK